MAPGRCRGFGETSAEWPHLVTELARRQQRWEKARKQFALKAIWVPQVEALNAIHHASISHRAPIWRDRQRG